MLIIDEEVKPLQRMLRQSAFWSRLSDAQRHRVDDDVVERSVPAGARICVNGAQIEYWFGVVDGMAKIENASADGRTTTLLCAGPGSWLGEGSVVKGGAWPYDTVALADTNFALMPRSTFEWLLDSSLGFNRFLIDHLNARLGQFIQRCEYLRLHRTAQHFAHCLAEMFDPVLYPGTTAHLSISQEEAAHLAGVSRPTANRALHELEQAGHVRVEYGAISVLDIDGLRRFGNAS